MNNDSVFESNLYLIMYLYICNEFETVFWTVTELDYTTSRPDCIIKDELNKYDVFFCGLGFRLQL